ncbi:hypothetical protein BaRGS_00023506 [Batillaria attramentaria]|uniref:Fibronectin type-III domain-containing protein n=1 Tax=Batillaria attramentaria TaxID=370345 RepID=A0ABD0KE95_9CAEN
MATRTDNIGLFVVALYLFAAMCTSSSCPDPEHNAMTPDDPTLLAGDPLRLCCNLTHANVTPHEGQVVFYRHREQLSDVSTDWATPHYVCMEQRADVTGKFGIFYYCHQRSRRKERCLGYQNVLVDDRPLPVESVDCVMEAGILTCSFAKPSTTQHFLFPDRLSVDVFYWPDGMEDRQSSCPLSCGDNHCVCTLNPGTPFNLGQVYKMNVTVTYNITRYDGSQTLRSFFSDFIVKPKDVVKVSPPRELLVTAASPYCFNITWVVTSILYNTSLFRLSLQSGLHKQPVEYVFPDNVTSQEVCGLTPFTTYNVTLQTRPRYSKLWSDPARASNTTLATVPETPPELSQGYALTDDNTAIFYWKPIPQNTVHGPGLHYIVHVLGQDTSQVPKVKADEGEVLLRRNFTSTQFHISLDKLRLKDRKQVYVKVHAGNDVGRSENASLLYLGKSTGGVREVRAVLEQDLNHTHDRMVHVNISWLPGTPHPVSYTIFWCRQRDQAGDTCDDREAVKWRSVGRETTWYILTLEKSLLGQLIYGVSQQYLHNEVKVTSSFRFHACVRARDKSGSLKLYNCEDTGPWTSEKRRKQVQNIVDKVRAYIFINVVVGVRGGGVGVGGGGVVGVRGVGVGVGGGGVGGVRGGGVRGGGVRGGGVRGGGGQFLCDTDLRTFLLIPVPTDRPRRRSIEGLYKTAFTVDTEEQEPCLRVSQRSHSTGHSSKGDNFPPDGASEERLPLASPAEIVTVSPCDNLGNTEQPDTASCGEDYVKMDEHNVPDTVTTALEMSAVTTSGTCPGPGRHHHCHDQTSESGMAPYCQLSSPLSTERDTDADEISREETGPRNHVLPSEKPETHTLYVYSVGVPAELPTPCGQGTSQALTQNPLPDSLYGSSDQSNTPASLSSNSTPEQRVSLCAGDSLQHTSADYIDTSRVPVTPVACTNYIYM